VVGRHRQARRDRRASGQQYTQGQQRNRRPRHARPEFTEKRHRPEGTVGNVSLIGELGPGARRVTVALLALCGLLAGCSTVTAGLALPADRGGPAPVPKTALRNTLLDAREINTVMGASSMKKQGSINELLPDDRSFDRSCLAPWQPIQRSVYADSGWTAVRAQLLSDEDDGHREHVAIEPVVGFPSRTEAADFFDQVAPAWTSCGGGQFTAQTSDDDESEWEFSSAETT
jgi:hypothetical protein